MMRRELRYLLAAVGAAFGYGYVALRRYQRSAGQVRRPGEARHAFVHRVTRPHLRGIGEVYDHMDDERGAA